MPAQISETEEFEFRARAEAEAARLPENKIGGDISPKPSESFFDSWKSGRLGESVLEGGESAINSTAQSIAHPIDTITGIAKKIPGAISSGVGAIAHPIDTAKSAATAVKNLTPEQMGSTAGAMLMGGEAGKALAPVADVAGAPIKSLINKTPLGRPVSQTVRDLANKGVVTTPGQRGGKMASAIEQRLTSEPIAGDAIKEARGRSTEQWNRSEINDAIKDAGGNPLPEARRGRDAIAHMEDQVSEGYARVLPKMKGSLHSPGEGGISFRQQISDRVGSNRKLDAEHSKLVHNIIDDDIVAKFKESGGYTRGDTIKEIEQTLREEADALRRGTYQEVQASRVIDQIRTDFKDMLKRENPKFAPELEKVDKGYAKARQISSASLYSTKGEGTFTPAQKLRAMKTGDKSKDKRKFASGRRPGQKQTEAVEKVLGNTEPDSGTPSRLMTADALRHPLRYGASAAVSPIYSQTVQKWLQNRALKRGQPYKNIDPEKAKKVGQILAASKQRDQQQ